MVVLTSSQCLNTDTLEYKGKDFKVEMATNIDICTIPLLGADMVMLFT